MAVSFDTSVTINAPASTVYSYVADLPRHVEWNHQPMEMESLVEGPVRVGSQYKTHEQLPANVNPMMKMMMRFMLKMAEMRHGAEDHTIAEITALDQDQRVAWKARAPSSKAGDLMRMNWEIRLTPQNGGTLVTQHCEVDPPEGSPFAGMVNENMANQIKGEVNANLNRLKGIVEAQ